MIADGQIGLPPSHRSACALCGLRGGVGVEPGLVMQSSFGDSIEKDILTSDRSCLSLLAFLFQEPLWERLGTSPGLSFPFVKQSTSLDV